MGLITISISGEVTEGKYAYQRKSYVRPRKHYYNSDSEEPYIKYGCPICEMFENKHSLPKGILNCPQCNVNLLWRETNKTVD